MYMYTYTYMYIFIHVCVQMYISIPCLFHIWKHMCIYMHIWQKNTRAHNRTHSQIFIYTHVCVCHKKRCLKLWTYFLVSFHLIQNWFVVRFVADLLFIWSRVYAKLNEYKGATQLLVQHCLSQKLARYPFVVAAHERIRHREMHWHDD